MKGPTTLLRKASREIHESTRPIRAFSKIAEGERQCLRPRNHRIRSGKGDRAPLMKTQRRPLRSGSRRPTAISAAIQECLAEGASETSITAMSRSKRAAERILHGRGAAWPGTSGTLVETRRKASSPRAIRMIQRGKARRFTVRKLPGSGVRSTRDPRSGWFHDATRARHATAREAGVRPRPRSKKRSGYYR